MSPAERSDKHLSTSSIRFVAGKTLLLPRQMSAINNKKPSSKPIPARLKTFYLYERDLLTKIYHVVDKYPIEEKAVCFSHKQLSEKYGVQVEEVENVNASHFLE